MEHVINLDIYSYLLRTKQLIKIPPKADVICGLLARAEAIEFLEQSSHGNTIMSPKEELLGFLGSELKERLQKLWKEALASKRIVYFLEVKAVQCIIENI